VACCLSSAGSQIERLYKRRDTSSIKQDQGCATVRPQCSRVSPSLSITIPELRKATREPNAVVERSGFQTGIMKSRVGTSARYLLP
jgi:hypothetical protein